MLYFVDPQFVPNDNTSRFDNHITFLFSYDCSLIIESLGKATYRTYNYLQVTYIPQKCMAKGEITFSYKA